MFKEMFRNKIISKISDNSYKAMDKFYVVI